MPKNPPDRTQRIIPYLMYKDAPAAIAFLIKAFGFDERERYAMPDGRIGHAELGYHDSVVMLASVWEGFGESPLDLPNVHGHTHCYVDDVDAHFARAKAAGATITAEPEDQFHGARSYRATDPEGHRWTFATVMRFPK